VLRQHSARYVSEADRVIAQPVGPPMRAGLLNRLKRLKRLDYAGGRRRLQHTEDRMRNRCYCAVAFCFMAFRAPR
jgi:hypothetical protein